MKKLKQILNTLKRVIISLVMIVFCFSPFGKSQTFKNQQLKHSRVKKAYQDKEKTLLLRYKQSGFHSLAQQIFLRAFKETSELELWAYMPSKKEYVLIHTYSICQKSGVLGPKRKEGDMQVPEGFYTIHQFNPYSNFYLSMKVSYPNMSDRILGSKSRLGGDIFIHGSCVTIGCMPLTDTFIKEVYIACVEARNFSKRDIPIHIFPYRMNSTSHALQTYESQPSLKAFWNNLKEGYTYFEKKKTLPIITVDKQGKYIFK